MTIIIIGILVALALASVLGVADTDVKRGQQGKLYYNTSGQSGGSWVELTIARDVTVSMEADEGDASTRATRFKMTEPTQIAVDVSFDMLYIPDDAGFDAFKTAFVDGSIIGIRAYDKASGEGPQFDAKVFKLERPEELNGVMTVACAVKPCYSATPPTWQDPA